MHVQAPSKGAFYCKHSIVGTFGSWAYCIPVNPVLCKCYVILLQLYKKKKIFNKLKKWLVHRRDYNFEKCCEAASVPLKLNICY